MRVLFRLKKYLGPFFGLIVTAILLAIPLSAIRVAPAPLVKHLIDDLLVNKDAAKLAQFPILFIGLFIANFFVRFGHTYALRVVVARVNQKIKNELFDHVMGLSADYFTAQSTGTLISRVGADPQHLDGGIASINVMIREPITFVLLFGYAISLNWRLALITLTIFPFLAWIFRVTGKNLKRYIGKMQEESARLFSTLQESFTGVRIIKMFRLEDRIRERFQRQNNQYVGFLLKTAILEETSHPLVELVTAFAISAVIYYGGSQVLKGQMTSGDLIAFFTAFAMMMNPIRQLNDISIKLHTATAAADRIFNLLDWKSNMIESPNPKTLGTFKNGIGFEKVKFAYPDSPEVEVLKGIGFDVPKGQTVAIVGASGAGKSSLVSLLPRLYDVTGGKITLDGIDLRDLKIEELRKNIAVVSQDVFLFNDSILENIRCGRLDATDEEVRVAAEKANAKEFIDAKPEGIRTLIGDRGQKLSGGERQRISIARAFLRDAPILILDEATSSLDSASERQVQAALEVLMRNKTTVVIAHRLSTIRSADRILVLKEGRVVEEGKHDELLARGGEFAHFHQMANSGPLK